MATSGTEFEAQVRLEFEDLERIQNKLADAIDKAFGQGGEMGDKLIKQFTTLEGKFANLKKIMATAKDEADFTNARESMQIIANDAQRLAKAVQKTKGVPLVDAGRIRAAAREMNQFARAQEFVAQKTIKTSLAAQNVVRIIQDAPFGMFGVANNIEQLAESFTMLMKQTGSVKKTIAGMFMPLVTGPMAIPFIISLFTAWTLGADKLAAQFDKLKVKIGLMTEAQAEFNEEMAKLEESGIKDLVASLSDEDLFFAEEEVTKKIDQNFARLSTLKDNFQKEFGFTLAEAQKAFDDFEAKQKQASTSGTGFGVAGVLSTTPEMKERVAALKTVQSELAKINKEAEDLAETEERISNRQRINREEFELARRMGLTEFGEDGSEGTKKKSEKRKKSIMSLEDKLTQTRISAMQDGVAKTIAQIRFNGEQERKQLVKNYGANAELMAALDEKIAQQVNKAAEDHTKQIVDGLRKEKKAREAELKRIAAEERRLRLANIKEQTTIAVFGLEQRALAIQNSSFGDAWEQEIKIVQTNADRERALIDARVLEMAELFNAGEMSQAAHNAEVRKLSQERIAISRDEADTIAQIERDKRDVIRDINQQTLGATSDFFGSMASIAESEGDKALETQKKYLFAQALAQAISSGISAYNAYMQMPGGPAKIGFAAASMLSITARLKAAATQIKNIKPGGGDSGSTAISGGFTQLNSAVVGQRIDAFQKQQSLDTTRRGNDDVVGAIDGLGNNLRNQNISARIVYDDRTAADIVEKGTRLNNQLTGRITANSFQG